MDKNFNGPNKDDGGKDAVDKMIKETKKGYSFIDTVVSYTDKTKKCLDTLLTEMKQGSGYINESGFNRILSTLEDRMNENEERRIQLMRLYDQADDTHKKDMYREEMRIIGDISLVVSFLSSEIEYLRDEDEVISTKEAHKTFVKALHDLEKLRNGLLAKDPDSELKRERSATVHVPLESLRKNDNDFNAHLN